MPTLLELTPQERQHYLQIAHPRNTPPELTFAERQERETLLTRVREAAAALKSHFGARRVVLFGSLAHAAWFTPDTDVDLAVEGLTGSNYWQAWKVVEDIIVDRPVDLIDMDTARTSLQWAIQQDGVEL